MQRRHQRAGERVLRHVRGRPVPFGVVEVAQHEVVGTLQVVPTQPALGRAERVRPCSDTTHWAGSESSLILSWMIGGGSTGFRSVAADFSRRQRAASVASLALGRGEGEEERCGLAPTFLFGAGDAALCGALSNTELIVFAVTPGHSAIRSRKGGGGGEDGLGSRPRTHLRSLIRDGDASTKVSGFIQQRRDACLVRPPTKRGLQPV